MQKLNINEMSIVFSKLIYELFNFG